MVLLSKFKRVFLKVFGVRKKAWFWALLTSTLIGLGLISFKSCGPSEDENYPGLCPLNCEGAAILPPGEYEIQPLVAGEGGATFGCSPNYDLEASKDPGWEPISGNEDTLRSKMAQQNSIISRIGGDPRPFPNAQLLKFKIVAVGGSGEGEDAGGVRGQLGIDVTVGGEGVSGGFPLANIRVNLSTVGGVWNTSVNKVKKEDTEYQGIATEPNYWCTDSCGVLSVKLNLICPAIEKKLSGYLNISSGSIAHSVKIDTDNLYKIRELPEKSEDDEDEDNEGESDGGNGGGGSGGDGSGGGGSGGGGSGGGGDSGS